MSVLFAVVVIILAGFTLHGYIKGFVRVVFSLISIILTIGLASWLSPYVSEILEKISAPQLKFRKKYWNAVPENSHTEKNPEK